METSSQGSLDQELPVSRRLVFALDAENRGRAEALLRMLAPKGITIKVGLEMLMRGGGEGLNDLLAGHHIIADPKLGGDISATTERALQQVCTGRDFQVDYVTVHDCVAETVAALRKIGSKAGVLRVTVLTDKKPEAFGGPEGLRAEVVRIACEAMEQGAAGVVCSPHEAEAVRAALGPGAVIMTPGCRPLWANVSGDDQKRTATIEDTFTWGASLAVIGRPIRDAESPATAAEMCIQEIERGLAARASFHPDHLASAYRWMPRRIPSHDTAMSLFLATGAVRDGHHVFKRGKHSRFFVNGPQGFSDPQAAAAISLAMVHELLPADLPKGEEVFFVGVANEGNVVAHALAHAAQTLRPWGRFRSLTTRKDGDAFTIDRDLGELIRDRPAIFIEGTMTTGTTTRLALKQLGDFYMPRVLGVMCVTRHGEEASAEFIGVPWVKVFNQLPYAQYDPAACELCRAGVPINSSPGYGHQFLAERSGKQPPYGE